jgi:hypothetical protein
VGPGVPESGGDAPGRYCPDFRLRRLRSARAMFTRWRLSRFKWVSVAGSRSGVAAVFLVFLRLIMEAAP